MFNDLFTQYSKQNKLKVFTEKQLTADFHVSNIQITCRVRQPVKIANRHTCLYMNSDRNYLTTEGKNSNVIY